MQERPQAPNITRHTPKKSSYLNLMKIGQFCFMKKVERGDLKTKMFREAYVFLGNNLLHQIL